jgi:hypothetical protein
VLLSSLEFSRGDKVRGIPFSEDFTFFPLTQKDAIMDAQWYSLKITSKTDD